MHSLGFCYRLNPQQKEQCLTKLEHALSTSQMKSMKTKPNSAFDEDETKSSSNNVHQNNRRLQIGNYLKLCRSNTISDDTSLAVITQDTNTNKMEIGPKFGKDATFWICDMIKSECLWMYISAKETFLINGHLQIYRINLNDMNNFAKICVDSSNKHDFSILQGSFMDKAAERKEFLIEDVICYNSVVLTSTLFDRMQKISKTVGNYRGINTKPSVYPFDFRGKPWIANNSGKGCIDFFKWYRTSSSTGSIMFHDGRHPENFSKGYMIWCNEHTPLSVSMLNFVYPPAFFIQIRLPIQARHKSHNGQRMGMQNKNGIVQDFNANMTTQSIEMHLRNDLDGIRTVPAIRAQFDSESMEKLIRVSQTNAYNQCLLCEIIYNKQKSCYTLINILNDSKIANVVEKNTKKYNDLLLKCGSTSTVHSASEKEKTTLLTSSVTEFVANCTQIIQSCAKESIVKAFQTVSKPFVMKKQQKQHQQLQQRHNPHHQQQQRHDNEAYTYRQYVPEPPKYSEHRT